MIHKASWIETASMHSRSFNHKPTVDRELRLNQCNRGWRGSIIGLSMPATSPLIWDEFERRLLEMGFVEGALIEVRHEGPIGRDPIAIRLDDTLVALRRRDAAAVIVTSRE